MGGNDHIFRKMTPVRIIESEGLSYIEVVFLESVQFYQLQKGNPAFVSILNSIRTAIENKSAIEIRFKSISSNVIEDI